VRVARTALAVAEEALPDYAHRFSPHRFTQPQLFACLALKTFFKTDYRGITHLLQDHSDLRCILRLKTVPHFTTLHKASRRLLRLPQVRRLLETTLRRHYRRRRRTKRVAFDSTGLDCGHRSAYYVRRRNGTAKQWQIVAYHHYAKLEASIDCSSHFVLAALAGRGPRVDVDRFVPLLQATVPRLRPLSILADAGYDSEPNHRQARQQGIRSFIPATAGRPTTKPLRGRYRRLMKQRLNKHYGKYGQRAQVETSFSMIKRRLTTTINARHYWSQCRELQLVVLCYNIMLLYAAVGFLQSLRVPFVFPIVNVPVAFDFLANSAT
jgi:Transposase DDE domain